MTFNPKVVPFNGRFENPKAMLAHIMDDDDLVGFAIVCKVKGEDGEEETMMVSSIGFSRAEMALGAAMLTARAMED